MDRYSKIQQIKNKFCFSQIPRNDITILGVCGSYGRGDFRSNSNIDIMFINKELSLDQKEKYVTDALSNEKIRIHEFENGNLFFNEINSIILRILFLSETIPFFHANFYWDLYSRIINSLSDVDINMQGLVEYKLSRYDAAIASKKERIRSLFPLQIQYVQYLRKCNDIEFQKKIIELSFSQKYEIITNKRLSL